MGRIKNDFDFFIQKQLLYLQNMMTVASIKSYALFYRAHAGVKRTTAVLPGITFLIV